MLFRKLYRPLCVHARTYLTSREEAEEVVQSVFIGFWEKRDTITIDSSLSSYLYRSVRNHALNVLKHDAVKRRHAEYAVTAMQESDESQFMLETEELQRKISAALAKLPDQCGLVFRMSRYKEMKYAEIAQELGISVKTVENHMGKALKIMREELRDYLPVIIILLSGFLD